jgi:hypothetical protein
MEFPFSEEAMRIKSIQAIVNAKLIANGTQSKSICLSDLVTEFHEQKSL